MIKPTILYQDKDILVINKPAGLTVHPDQYSTGPFLTDWLLREVPSIKDVGEDEQRPGLVHRLDKDTSGVMIVAKTPAAFKHLKEQFKNRLVKKTYLAILVGELPVAVGEERVIDWPIGRSGQDPRRRVASRKAYGRLRPAETRFHVAEHLPGFTLVEACPLSGRTHQLRAHFKAYQHPIACDGLYGTGHICPPGLARHALHAVRLDLILPNNEPQNFTAPLPADMIIALEHLRRS